MSVVAPTKLNFGRIVLNLISYFLTICNAINIKACREVLATEVRNPEIYHGGYPENSLFPTMSDSMRDQSLPSTRSFWR